MKPADEQIKELQSIAKTRGLTDSEIDRLFNLVKHQRIASLKKDMH